MKIVDRVQFNKENNDPYVATFEIKDHIVNVFLDDYGQQYYLEYLDDDGEVTETGCGAYCFDYIDQIAYIFDPKGWTISVEGKEAWNQRMAMRASRGLESIDYDDYDTYDFDSLYKQAEKVE